MKDLKIQQRDGNENVKKKRKPPTLHMHHTFLHISLPFLHDYNVKMPYFAFNEERKQSSLRSVRPGETTARRVPVLACKIAMCRDREN